MVGKHRGATSFVHEYLSTACLHEQYETDAMRAKLLHAYCAAERGQCGEKIPGQCKWCDAPCGCSQH